MSKTIDDVLKEFKLLIRSKTQSGAFGQLTLMVDIKEGRPTMTKVSDTTSQLLEVSKK